MVERKRNEQGPLTADQRKWPDLKKIEITVCEDCLNAVPEECHTPGCAFWLQNSLSFPVHPDSYLVIETYPDTGDWQ